MKIVVLCGGISTEREISIVSGTGVCKALRARGHQAILLDVFFGDEYARLMDAFPEEYDVDEAAEYIRSMDENITSAVANPHRSYFGANVTKLCKMADIVFLALHGADGENGKVQAAFDLRKIRYTGTGYIGSALSMDKTLTKIMLKAHGIPVPPGFSMTRPEWEEMCNEATLEHEDADDAVRQLAAHLIARHNMTFPLVVKVACGGSSVGVYMTGTVDELVRNLTEAFTLEEEVIVEERIEGREFSVGVIDGEALPIIEIAPKVGFYDYKNKYTAGSTIETCPAELDGGRTRRMKEYAEAAYHALQLDSYGRMDFMMRENGDMYCLESNTLPGMTPTSLVPQEAAALGISFGALCEKLIEVSMKKYR